MSAETENTQAVEVMQVVSLTTELPWTDIILVTSEKSVSDFPTVNLDKLWSLVSSTSLAHYSKDKSKVPVIDVTKAGFFKVLGKGFLPAQPVVVRAKFFSKKA